MKRYKSWGAAVRWFHWINVLSIVALAAIGLVIYFGRSIGLAGEGKIAMKTLHVWVGYVFAANLAVRLVGAFAGDKRARWSAFLPIRRGLVSETRDYLQGLRAGDAPAYVGHTPPGRLMIFFLLLLLTVMAGTGLVLAGTDVYMPPFGAWIREWVAAPGIDPSTLVAGIKTMQDPTAYAEMRRFRAPFIWLHKNLFWVLSVGVVVHVAAIAVLEVREKSGLVSAMLSGEKVLDKTPEDEA